MLNIAVAGNPNCGKTCVFNNLTGARQHVGNYPGVTVELFEGFTVINGKRFHVTDLPGTYSLTAYSKDELVARNFLIDKKPDVIVNVVDASNLERNLYLTLQLIELKIPVVIALNMGDIAVKKGFVVNPSRLGAMLGVKVVETIARNNSGMEELKTACSEIISESLPPRTIHYSSEIEDCVSDLEKILSGKSFFPHVPDRWTALKMLEQDETVISCLKTSGSSEKLFPVLEKYIQKIHDLTGDDSETAIAEARCAAASGIFRDCVSISKIGKRLITEKIDSVVCNRYLGPLILVVIVYMLFTCVFKVADELQWIPLFNGEWVSPVGLFSTFFDFLSETASTYIKSDILKSMIKDGIIGGVGGVMGFVPLIFLMFVFISALEDSGYVARIAFILDRLLRAFGLQGKSVLSLIVSGGLGGGGCAVPGVMAARTLREEKDRLITILVTPMMNCGAKLPVYAMLIAAFFPDSRGQMMFLLWALSWAFSLMAALFLRKFIIAGEQTPFVMELPVYHMPAFKNLFIHAWSRTWLYIKKAGTIILGINLIFWSMMYFPHQDTVPDHAEEQLRHSFAGRTGSALEYVSKYIGFDWKINIALIGGFAAKELVIGTLGTVYSMGDDALENPEPLSAKLSASKDWSPLRAFALMVFVMLYAPCMPTVAAIRRETGAWKWAVFSVVYSTTFAFVIAFIIYNSARIFS
ncbi:MAG: ferrous iron transport protein B [Lentisphaerae bacterium GWF2_45_14]|nr:MAG: ferrous iron transport protein B [Lentisphaerae bacterium GWF2_45_14]